MTLTFKEALELGKELLPEANYFTEEEEAFIFSVKNSLDIGGSRSPVVILKATGQSLGLPAYLVQGHPDDILDCGWLEVPEAKRREILEGFDRIEFATLDAWMVPRACLAISKTETGYLLQCSRPLSGQEDGPSVELTGIEAECLRIEVGKLQAHEWGKGFWPPPDMMVLDGYSWTMDFFKDGDFFHAEGDNAAPQELFAFHDFIASLGLPRMEALDAIESNGWEASTISPHERLEICREANHQDAHVFADNGKKQAHFDM